jgi:hypothetical protein
MKIPSFSEGVTFALAVSLLGSILFTTLIMLFPAGWLLKMLVAGISLVYVIYLLSRSQDRIGRFTVLAVWLAISVGALLVSLSFLAYVMVHIGMIWLIRSLYFYTSVFSAFADLVLNGLSLAAAVWASVQTESVFLTIWCFFLVQALFVVIPSSLKKKSVESKYLQDCDDRFQRSYKTAEIALRKLSSEH